MFIIEYLCLLAVGCIDDLCYSICCWMCSNLIDLNIKNECVSSFTSESVAPASPTPQTTSYSSSHVFTEVEPRSTAEIN